MSRDEFCVVLLKIVGFTLAVRALLLLPSSVGAFASYLFIEPAGSLDIGAQMRFNIFMVLFGTAVQIVGGLVVIAMSRPISRWVLAFGQSFAVTSP